MNNWIASGQYDDTQGIWTSGMDQEIVDAIKAAGKPFVPVVGADRGGFVNQLLDETGFEGLEGAAVTNTAAVGGAGVALALKLLNKEDVETADALTVLLTPVVASDDSDEGRKTAGVLARRGPRSDVAAGHHDRGLDDLHPGAGHRLQGPRRGVILRRTARAQRGDAGHAGIPCCILHLRGPMTATSTDLLLEATGITKTYGAVVALKVGVAGRAPGRGPRAHGRQRRRQEHARQDPDRRRPTRTPGPSPCGAGSAPSTPPPRPAAAASSPSTRSRRSSPTWTSAPTCASPRHQWSRSGTGSASSASTDLDLSSLARRLPLASLRIIDLARALAIEPDVLMLDEMTAALPANLTERVLEVVGRQRGGDRSVIFISHRLIEIAAVCDRATVLREGETVGVVDMTEGSEERIVELMLGEIVEGVPARATLPWPRPLHAAPRPPEPRLAARGLAFGAKLHDVSFDLHPGEVLGVVALEGQGQDELFDVLAGSRAPDSGELLVDGAPVSFHHPADAIRAGLVYVAADRAEALLMQRSVRENIALPFTARIRRWGLINLGDEKTEGRRRDRRRSRSTPGPRARCAGSPAATSRR